MGFCYTLYRNLHSFLPLLSSVSNTLDINDSPPLLPQISPSPSFLTFPPDGSFPLDPSDLYHYTGELDPLSRLNQWPVHSESPPPPTENNYQRIAIPPPIVIPPVATKMPSPLRSPNSPYAASMHQLPPIIPSTEVKTLVRKPSLQLPEITTTERPSRHRRREKTEQDESYDEGVPSTEEPVVKRRRGRPVCVLMCMNGSERIQMKRKEGYIRNRSGVINAKLGKEM